MADTSGSCKYCGKDFDHLPAHEWQCAEKPEETDETDDTDGTEQSETVEESDNTEQQKSDRTSESNRDSDSTRNSSGVIVDDVKPVEKDSRKNPEQQDNQNDQDEWVEIDHKSGQQVKTMIKTTDLSNPKDAVRMLKAFETGNQEDIPQFDEIRLSDGELR